MKADLSKIYKEFVENGKQVPPEGLWDNISNQLDIDDSWTEISNQLDLEQVWNNVSQELETGIVAAQKSSFTRSWYGKSAMLALSAAVLVLIVLFTGKRLSLSDENISSNPELQVQINEDAGIKDDSPKGMVSLEAISENKITEEPNQDLSGLNELINPVSQAEKAPVQEETRINTDNILSDDIVDNQSLLPPPIIPQNSSVPETGKSQPVALVYNQAENNSFVESSILPLKNEELSLSPILPLINQEIRSDSHENELLQSLKDASSANRQAEHLDGKINDPRIWRLGFTLNGNNNWLINQETFSGFDASELNTTVLNFSAHWELVADIPLHRKWWIRTTAFGQNTTGQRYKNYFEGTYSPKNIELKYAGINLLAKHRSHAPWLGDERISFNTHFGFYFNLLWSAEETIGTVSVDVSDQYKNTDYGLVFGHEIEFQAWNRISLAPGFKLNWGIPNIYEGNDKIPSSFKATHNGSVELTFGIYYLLTR